MIYLPHLPFPPPPNYSCTCPSFAHGQSCSIEYLEPNLSNLRCAGWKCKYLLDFCAILWSVMKMFQIHDLYRFTVCQNLNWNELLTLKLRDRISIMMVAILNFICDANCAQQNCSILVKSILYHVKLICKMFPHKAVIISLFRV